MPLRKTETYSSDQLWLPGPLPRSAGTCSRDVRASVLRQPSLWSLESGSYSLVSLSCLSPRTWAHWVVLCWTGWLANAHETKWAFCFPYCATVCEYRYFSGFPQEVNLVKEDNHQNRKWTHVFNNTKRLCSFVTRVWDNFCKPLSFSLFSIPIYIWLLKHLNADCIPWGRYISRIHDSQNCPLGLSRSIWSALFKTLAGLWNGSFVVHHSLWCSFLYILGNTWKDSFHPSFFQLVCSFSNISK